MHLADTFIQSDLQCIQATFCMCSLGIEPTTFCAANVMLYHRAKGTYIYIYLDFINGHVCVVVHTHMSLFFGV